MAWVYFATNRQPDTQQQGGFGANIVASGMTTYGAINVSNTSLTKEDSGTLGPVFSSQPGTFNETLVNQIVDSGKNLLVFIHGFDNSFRDAITRAAFNRDWVADSGRAGTDMTVLAFTWPSLGKLINSPFDPKSGYKTDQGMAAASGNAIAAFFGQVKKIRQKFPADRRVVLLAHSMGNFALGSALTSWFAGGNPLELLFDDVILAAADETDDSFLDPSKTRFSRLGDLTSRISVYSSRRDVAMSLSCWINNGVPLGFDGPKGISAPSAYPYCGMGQNKLRSIDCTEVHGFLAMIPPDATHQYYRRSRTVRDDMAAVIAQDRVHTGRSILLASLI